MTVGRTNRGKKANIGQAGRSIRTASGTRSVRRADSMGNTNRRNSQVRGSQVRNSQTRIPTKRRKRKKNGFLRLIRFLFVVAILIFAAKFGLDFIADRDVSEPGTTIKIGMFGGITEYINEDFPESSYDFEEFQAELEKQIQDYCELSGNGKAVTLKKLKWEEEKISVVIKYSADSDYRNFNAMDLYSGKVEELISKGLEFSEQLQPVNEEEAAASLKELGASSGYKVLYAEDVHNLYIPGKIKYYSGNCELTGKRSVRITDEKPACIIYK